MKKIFCATMALLFLFCAAFAETSVIEQPEIIIQMITPTPSPAPVGEVFSSEDLIVTLPVGLSILDETQRAGYDAAVRFDNPDADDALVLAVSEDASAALSFSILETDTDAISAAQAAADSLSDVQGAPEEIDLEQNHYAVLRCTADENEFLLYFLSNGTQLICVGASGVSQDELDAMLRTLEF